MPRAAALDENRLISQYAHSAWRTQDGVFGGTPVVITQTTDGYLWIGTNIGLVRFDGMRFVPWTPPEGKRLLDSRIYALTAASDGSLWIGTGNSVSHWRGSELINYPEPRGRVESVVADADGAAWMVRSQAADGKGPLCQINTHVQCYGDRDGLPFANATMLARGEAGSLWIGGYSGLSHWIPGVAQSRVVQTYFENKISVSKGIDAIKAIAATADGAPWVCVEKNSAMLQLERFEHGRWSSRSYPAIRVSNAEVEKLFVDRDNALWIGTAQKGIYRIQGDAVDHFGSEDGLSSDAVASFFQDAEGSIWVVTSGGVDNFRDLRVESYSMHQGMSADGASSVIAARDGTIWAGNFQALSFVRDGRAGAVQKAQGFPGRNVTTLFEDHAGKLWLGIDGGLWTYDGSRFEAIRHADGSLLGNVFTIAEDRNDDLWVRAGPNLDRIHNSKIEEEHTSLEISTAYIMAADPAGGVILGRVNGDLVRYRDSKLETISPGEGTNRQQIRDLLVETDGSIWATTREEVVRWKDGQRRDLTMKNGFPCDEVHGLTRDHLGSTWFATRCGLVSIQNAELEKWWAQPDHIVSFRMVDPFEGVQPGLASLKPQIVTAPDGRLWFVNTRVLEMFDPADTRKNVIPPPVHVGRIYADQKSYSSQDRPHLPKLTRDLEINYTALSFVAPQKVRYRYKVEGYDTGWHDPDTRRQAVYNDLPPGSYRFRVIACNNDGVWNETGATWSFSVDPAYYQTYWFRALCVLLAALVLWLMYRLRMRHMRETVDARFDERIAERTRLARELHDTLLQTIQGSKMVADDALDSIDDPSHMRRALERLSIWLAQATEEGRTALNSLRTATTGENDLAGAFERASTECNVLTKMEVSLVVDGANREMHPVVRDEVYRVGYEAIRNACRHSGGTRMEVELTYGRDLVLRVRDNGKGIPADMASSGRDGHYGLRGMDERAAHVGGVLTLSSSTYAGTEVELIIPGKIAFADAASRWPGLVAELKDRVRSKRRSGSP